MSLFTKPSEPLLVPEPVLSQEDRLVVEMRRCFDEIRLVAEYRARVRNARWGLR